jgi:hypothetical protein
MKTEDRSLATVEQEKAELEAKLAEKTSEIAVITARLEALDLAISALTSSKTVVPQAAAKKKRRRRAKIKRTSPRVQREIEAHCYQAIEASVDKRLTTGAVAGSIEQHFGVGRSLTAVEQMLSVCPCFVRIAPASTGSPTSWRCITEDEWEAAYLHAADRNWPGSDDFELACYGEGEDEEEEETEEESQGRLDFETAPTA